jgi:hypothetical protein
MAFLTTDRGTPMARSLAERLRAHEQQKARLAEEEAKIRDAERKARTRRLIEAGALVEKTGLLDLDVNALYGALLSLKQGVGEAEQVAQWAALGGRTFAREARLRDEGKEPIVLTFPAPLPKEVTATLRAAGFRFSKVLQHWEGLAKPDDADAIAKPHGGTVRRINPPVDAGSQPNGQPPAGDHDDGHGLAAPVDAAASAVPAKAHAGHVRHPLAPTAHCRADVDLTHDGAPHVPDA